MTCMSILLNNARARLLREVPLLILCLGAVAALFIALSAGALSPFDIEFPIPELGNCADKGACKAYCDDEENAEACQTFAEYHGFSSKSEVNERVRKIEEDGGPGGCARDEKNPVRACKRYCDDTAHIEECVGYAKREGLMEGEELEEAEKVVAALRRGVKLPPQCKNAESCRAVCEDPSDLAVARACFEFGKESGLLPDDISVEQAEKAFAALESGTGPFTSFAEMRQCDDPPNDEVFEKCIAFALEAGFLPSEEAEMVRKTGGKGPGGCRGRDACEAYCENPANQEACFRFAEEHDLLSEDDREMMREGVEQMQEAFEDAPPEVEACIREAVPELDAILSGEKFPRPAIGEAIQTCFEDFFRSEAGGFGGEFGEDEFSEPPAFGGGRDGDDFGEPPGRAEREFPGRTPQFPPEVAACLEEKLGEEFFSTFGKRRPSAGEERTMRECFEEARRGDQGGEDDQSVSPEPPGGVEGTAEHAGETGGAPRERFQEEFQRQYKAQYEQEVKRQVEEQFNRQYEEQYRREVERRTEDAYRQEGERLLPPPASPDAGGRMPPAPVEGGAPTSFYIGPNTELIGSVLEALRQARGR